MLPKDNYYIGFLTNVDSSILKVKLEHGFSFDSMKATDYQSYIDVFKGDEVFYGLYKSYFEKVISLEMPTINKKDGKLYFMKNSSENYDKNQEYPDKILQIMRLYKEGNIWIPVAFNCEKIRDSQNRPNFSSSSSTLHIVSFPKYTLSNDDIKNLDRFLKTFKIPFSRSYLHLAFDNFEISYKVHNRNLSFLTLMIGFEALFNRGGTELTQTVSRHTAILLGKERSDFERIYKDMREFYAKRSHIVHAIKPKKRKPLEDKDITILRNYLRECIKKVYLLDCEKEELYKSLNSQGF